MSLLTLLAGGLTVLGFLFLALPVVVALTQRDDEAEEGER